MVVFNRDNVRKYLDIDVEKSMVFKGSKNIVFNDSKLMYILYSV